MCVVCDFILIYLLYSFSKHLLIDPFYFVSGIHPPHPHSGDKDKKALSLPLIFFSSKIVNALLNSLRIKP